MSRLRNTNIYVNQDDSQGHQVRFLTLSNSYDARYVLTSSFSSSVKAVGDVRYILTSSAVEQRTDNNLVVSGTLKIRDAFSNYSQHLILSSSAGSIVALSGALQFAGINSNRFQINALGTDLVLSSSGPAQGGGRTIISGSLIIPRGGGLNGGGQGLAIGSNKAFEALYIVDGNIYLQGTNEVALSVKRTGLANNPVFQWGRIVTAGDGSPEMRFVYFDDVTPERSLFEFDNKGIFASVKPSIGSHWEGFITGAIQPMFRLNSYPSMSLELGQGGDTTKWTDVILRRGDQGRLRIISQLSGGAEVTGSLDVSNIYHSLAHLVLSSSAGSLVVISGAFGVGNLTNTNKDSLTPKAGTLIWNTTSGSLQVYTGTVWKIITTD